MNFYNFGVYEALIKLGFDPASMLMTPEDYGGSARIKQQIAEQVRRAEAEQAQKRALRAAQEAKDVEIAQSAYNKPTAPQPRATPRATPPPIPLEARGTMPDIPSGLGMGTIRAPSPERWRTMASQPTTTSFVDPALAATKVGPAPIATTAETAAKAPVSALTKFKTFLRSMRPFIPKG